MNCKPGDLAMLVNAYCPENIGLLVVVLSEGRSDADGWNWVTESARPTPTTASPDRYAYCPDKWLRPIRPGDISDEEVRDLYAPKLPEVA